MTNDPNDPKSHKSASASITPARGRILEASMEELDVLQTVLDRGGLKGLLDLSDDEAAVFLGFLQSNL
jgi:hypothetical protein